MYTLIDS